MRYENELFMDCFKLFDGTTVQNRGFDEIDWAALDRVAGDKIDMVKVAAVQLGLDF